MKKVLFIFGSILIVLIILTIIWSCQSNKGFACSDPPYFLVINGMNMAEIQTLLGQPDQKVIKENLSDYTFGQGDLETKIKSGWLYNLADWDGGLEIYFDTYEIVIGKNCGEG